MNIFKYGFMYMSKNSMLMFTAEECKMIASFLAGVVCTTVFFIL